MHLSIIAETKMVSVKGISLILENLDLPKDFVEVHWLDGKGWEEYRVGDKIVIKDIENIDHYQSVIDAYNEEYAKIPHNEIPIGNMDLLDFIEDALLNIEVMKNSPEWEEFKIATNRA